MRNEYRGLGFEANILIFMHGKDRILRRRFMDEGGFNFTSAKNALERLESVGLTEYQAVGDYRGSVYWSLTDKGKDVAKTFKELDDRIRNE